MLHEGGKGVTPQSSPAEGRNNGADRPCMLFAWTSTASALDPANRRAQNPVRQCLEAGFEKLLTGWEMTGLAPVPSAGPVGLGGVTVVVVVSLFSCCRSVDQRLAWDFVLTCSGLVGD